MTGVAPFAEQQLTPVNFDVGRVVRPAQGMVVHTAVGSYDGTIGWMHDPASKVSSYFVVAQDGRIAQVVLTTNRAWTQAAGNAAWVGVENEGNPATPLTPAQIKANGQILAWLHQVYGVPLALTTDPINGRGLGFHSMGGVAWSPAHHDCPGPIIVGQLPQILAAAVGHPAPTPGPDLGDAVKPHQFPPITLDDQGSGSVHCPEGNVVSIVPKGGGVKGRVPICGVSGDGTTINVCGGVPHGVYIVTVWTV